MARLLAVHIGWTFRWMVLMEVQTVAKNTAGYYHYAIEAGSSGLLGIIGTFGLWLAALLIIDILVPWKKGLQAKYPPIHVFGARLWTRIVVIS